MAIEFNMENMRKVRELAKALEAGPLKQANDQKVEAALAIFALCQCARRLLDLYPSVTRAALVEAIIPFLEGDTAATTDINRLLVN